MFQAAASTMTTGEVQCKPATSTRTRIVRKICKIPGPAVQPRFIQRDVAGVNAGICKGKKIYRIGLK